MNKQPEVAGQDEMTRKELNQLVVRVSADVEKLGSRGQFVLAHKLITDAIGDGFCDCFVCEKINGPLADALKIVDESLRVIDAVQKIKQPDDTYCPHCAAKALAAVAVTH